ncbi:hypothetical protein QOU18_12170 [Pseudomonas aeruginosa]|uniref:hypothetical protein n=1 Tax=Pseudomonas aeruginosa TaxID=287 RepID=UPI002340EF5C|nr:hypothetical protein [Pseudomonas aeruginosa]
MSPQQARCCEAIHENDLAGSDKASCESKRFCLLANSSTNIVAMLSLLRSRDLVRITGTKGANNKVLETDFILTKIGYDICSTAVSLEPMLQWYADRAELVAKVAGTLGGTALKQKQYQRASYAETKLGGVIPAITEDVRVRLTQLQSD